MANVNQTTFKYAALSMTATTTARGITGPVGARAVEFYVSTAAATVYVQVGADVVDGSTDISADGGPVPTETWVRVACEPSEAPAPVGESSQRPAIYLQTNTNPTAVRYRFLRSEG